MSHIALVVCAAPLAQRALEISDHLHSAGHQVTVCPTPTAAGDAWVDLAELDDYLRDERRLRPDAVVIAPATFHTINAWTAGLNDNPVLQLLNDALGLGTPILAVPTIATRLSRHPAWKHSIATLGNAVSWLDLVDGTVHTHPRPIPDGAGRKLGEQLDPAALSQWVIRAEKEAPCPTSC